MQETWTIDELLAEVSLHLADDEYPGQPDARVRDVPDVRTLRYYTTLGLVDRPQALRGRTALYGRRHLLQLVAVKRLQTQGLSLAEIQKRLLGLPTPELGRLAQIKAEEASPAAAGPPDEQNREGTGLAQAAEASAAQRRVAFWRAPPAAAEQPPAEPAAAEPGARASRPLRFSHKLARPRELAAAAKKRPEGVAAGRRSGQGQLERSSGGSGMLVGVPLGDEFTLLLRARREVLPEDVQALAAAAAPLARLLRKRRLL